MAVIHVDDPSTVGEIRRFPSKSWRVKSLAFSANGGLLAVGTSDDSLMIYDVDRSTRVSHQDDLENLGDITCLTFTPDGRKLLSGGYHGRIQVWNVSPEGVLTRAKRFVGHNEEIRTIVIGADGKTVLSGGDEKLGGYSPNAVAIFSVKHKVALNRRLCGIPKALFQITLPLPSKSQYGSSSFPYRRGWPACRRIRVL